MSRCYICDYSEEVGNKSLYYRGIKTHEAKYRRMYIDKRTGNPICNTCQDIINADLCSKTLEKEKL